MRLINFIVLHTCAAYDVKRKRVVHQSRNDIDAYHKAHNGWRSIGYHWFVEVDGKGVQGRPDDEVGAHAGGFNAYTLGLCVSGHGDHEAWNAKQLDEVIRKCAQWCRTHRLSSAQVIGHRETDEHGGPPVAKTCPGLLIDMDRVRDLLAERLETSG